MLSRVHHLLLRTETVADDAKHKYQHDNDR